MGSKTIAWRPARLAGLLAAAFLLCLATLPPALPPAMAAPACAGRDVVADMRTGDPAAYRRLVAMGDGEVNGTGKFWRIERQGLAPSFLFGTMHATDGRATALPPLLRRALAGVNTLIVESLDALDPKRSEQAMAASKSLLVYADGRGLAERLTAGRRAALAAALAKTGIDLGQAGALKPWMLAMALSVPACETARRAEAESVDVVLADLARRLGKPIQGLESMAEQFTAFDTIAEDMQVELLISAARLFPRLNDVFATMTALYVDGRIGRLKALSVILSEQTGVSDAANAAFNANLIDARNERMFSRALPGVEKGGVMIAVGALHLPGEGGLVQRFRGAGFTVTRLY